MGGNGRLEERDQADAEAGGGRQQAAHAGPRAEAHSAENGEALALASVRGEGIIPTHGVLVSVFGER